MNWAVFLSHSYYWGQYKLEGQTILAEKWQYGSGNVALRSTLYGIYDRRCYRCQELKSFVEIEIDHIVPNNTNDDEFGRIREEYKLGKDFRRNDPSNLAPICTRCNRLKSGRPFSETLHELDFLRRAGERRQKVINEVEKFFGVDNLAQALVKATVSNLEDPRTKETLVTYAPAFVQKIASVDEALVRFTKVSHEETSIGGTPVRLRSALSQEHRVIVEILENAFYVSFWDVVKNKLDELVEQIKTELDAHALETLEKEDPYFPEHPGPAHIAHIGLEVSAVTLSRADEGLVVTFNAGLEIQQLRSIPYQREDGLWGQKGDAYGYVRLSRQLVQASFDSTHAYELRDYEVISRDFDVAEYV